MIIKITGISIGARRRLKFLLNQLLFSRGSLFNVAKCCKGIITPVLCFGMLICARGMLICARGIGCVFYIQST
jgi:hypothetical protein